MNHYEIGLIDELNKIAGIGDSLVRGLPALASGVGRNTRTVAVGRSLEHATSPQMWNQYAGTVERAGQRLQQSQSPMQQGHLFKRMQQHSAAATNRAQKSVDIAKDLQGGVKYNPETKAGSKVYGQFHGSTPQATAAVPVENQILGRGMQKGVEQGYTGVSRASTPAGGYSYRAANAIDDAGRHIQNYSR